MPGLFSYLGTGTDKMLAAFLTNTSTSVAVMITPLAVTGLTIYIMMYGIAVMRHEVNDPVTTFGGKILKMSFIFAIALGGGVYQTEVVGGIYAFIDGMSAAISVDGKGIIETLDNFDEQSTKNAFDMIQIGLSNLPTGGYLDIIAGLLLFTSNTVMCILCAGMLILAKVSLVLSFAIGPFFIMALAFPPTAKMFDSWFADVMTNVWLLVLLGVCVTASTVLSAGYVTAMAGNTGITNGLVDTFGLIAVQGALLFVTYKIMDKAAHLGGGIVLSGASNIVSRMVGGGGSGGGGKGGGSDTNSNSNSISGAGSGQAPGAASPGAGTNPGAGHVPAYRRATLDRLR